MGGEERTEGVAGNRLDELEDADKQRLICSAACIGKPGGSLQSSGGLASIKDHSSVEVDVCNEMNQVLSKTLQTKASSLASEPNKPH